MASLFLRLVKGNEDNPGVVDDGISIHSFLGALNAWQRGELGPGATGRAAVIATFNLTVDDESDLDAIKGWYNGSTDKKAFERVIKDRLYMAEDKSGVVVPGSPISTGGLNGHFGYAVKSIFINGADGATHLNSF